MMTLMLAYKWLLSAFAWLLAGFLTHWRLVLTIAGIVGLIAVTILGIRSCNRKPVKVDLETLNKVNSQNEAEHRQGVKEAVEKNQEVIETVDERSTIAEVNRYQRDAAIAEKVKAVDAKIHEAKRSDGDVTASELECILTGDCE